MAAILGLALLRRWFGRLGTPETWDPLRRVAVASLAMGVIVLVVSNLSGSTQGFILFARVVGAVVAGIVVYVGVASPPRPPLRGPRPGGPAPRHAAARGPSALLLITDIPQVPVADSSHARCADSDRQRL